MGHGSYSYDSSVARATVYKSKSSSEIFKQRGTNDAMNPHGITVRESRDSAEHPNSIPIILALDTTGSMGSIPTFLVKQGLLSLMDKIIKAGLADPQVLFMGIGDHECDSSPLQVGQFESSDALLDAWLTKLWIEGGGGGNEGESYLLAWFFASRYTSTDHNEKRGKKGLLFTIGDEPTLKHLPKHTQKHLMGDGQYSDTTASELLEKAREKYDVFHLHILQGSRGNDKHTKDGWTELMGDNVLFVQNKEDVAQIIADKVVEISKTQGASVKVVVPSTNKDVSEPTKVEDEMML